MVRSALLAAAALALGANAHCSYTILRPLDNIPS